VLTLLTVAVAAWLALRRLWGATWLLLASVGGGIVVSTLLKLAFERARPDLVPHGSHVSSASFPSGHSMMAAVVYLTLGVLLARVEPRRRTKAYVLSVAVILTLLVGVSRVYLGVHWPTDVLAGWSIGAGWALLCWLVARWLQRRGAVETDAEG
jgi:undecaprenyl-diphosphatase